MVTITTGQAVIAQEGADKVSTLHPYIPSTYERMNKADEIMANARQDQFCCDRGSP